MAVVHSHRHNKDDTRSNIQSLPEPIANEESSALGANVDFTLVRDTMYKYSKQAQKRFFENPALAFMFAWFATSSEGMNFIQSKYNDKG